MDLKNKAQADFYRDERKRDLAIGMPHTQQDLTGRMGKARVTWGAPPVLERSGFL